MCMIESEEPSPTKFMFCSRLLPFKCRREPNCHMPKWTATMRLSVIIPVYNRQALAERAIRSALAQSIEGMEIVVVDDGSQPPFLLPDDIKASPHVSLVRHDSNRGPAAARNSGIANARGEWIALL